MSEETVEGPKINEIGRNEFDRLTTVLSSREKEECNVIGWGGDSVTLKASVENHELFPTSAFAVVAKGVSEYKYSGNRPGDDPISMRDFASALSSGAEVFPQAIEMHESQIKDQIKEYIESRGGVFDENIEWQAFIQNQVNKIKDKATAWEAANG